MMGFNQHCLNWTGQNWNCSVGLVWKIIRKLLIECLNYKPTIQLLENFEDLLEIEEKLSNKNQDEKNEEEGSKSF